MVTSAEGYEHNNVPHVLPLGWQTKFHTHTKQKW